MNIEPNERSRPSPFLRSTRGRVALVLAGVLVTAVAIAAPASAANEPQPTRTVVAVKNRVPFTNTGVALTKGETVSVRTTGTMNFGGGAAAATTPNGLPWGPACANILNAHGRRARWPAPGINCWSLIGRIGSEKPFEIGTAATFKAANDGTLYLGLNDNFAKDNHGHWVTAVAVTPAVPAKSHTTTYLLIALAVVVLLVLLLLLWLYRKRPKREKPEKAEVAAAAVVPADLTNLPPGAAEPATAPLETEAAVATIAQPFAGPQADSIDVNIFEVEFSNGLTLRIGYNHFPDGTNVRWRVTQDRLPVAVGAFVTEGGGSTNHFETVPLGVKLEGRDAKPEGADVQFDWSIDGVPFKYSVRRDPNC